MDMDIGDWTTYDGLAQENDFEPVVFGKKAAAAPKQPAAAAAASSQRPEKKGFHDHKLGRGINKKKKKNRGAGLYNVVPVVPATREELEAEDSEEDDEMVMEGPAVPSPHVVSTKNAFSILGDLQEQEEAAEEAARLAAAKEAAASEEAAAAAARVVKAAANPKPKAEAAAPAVAQSPIVRRTRNAIKGISKMMSDVVVAVSPMLERSRSTLVEQPLQSLSNVFADMTGAAANAQASEAPAAPPAAKVTSTKTAAAKAPAKVKAAAKEQPAAEPPIRRSTRLRSGA